MVDPRKRAAESQDAAKEYSSSPPTVRTGMEFCGGGPTCYVLDAGRWLDDRWTLGLISGSHLMVCEMSLRTQAKDPPLTGTAIDPALKALSGAMVAPAILDQRIVRPWRPEDFKHPEEILLSREKLLVVIPDCHLGIRDTGDAFSPSGQKNALRALLFTISALRKALGSAVKIVQLGDFVEVWETEASPAVYHAGADESTFFDDAGWDAHRERRARRAIAGVWEKWKGDLASRKGAFDLMLPGNHDIERLWESSGFDALGTLVRKRRIRTGRGLGIVMEHGHHRDRYNDTRNAKHLHDVMKTTDGKAYTYVYARNKPGRDWPDPGPSDPKEVFGDRIQYCQEPGCPYHNLDWFSFVQNHKVPLLGKNLVDHFGELGVGKSHTAFVEQLLIEAQQANGSGSTDDPAGYQLPVRVWVHAHTHEPRITACAWTRGSRDRWPFYYTYGKGADIPCDYIAPSPFFGGRPSLLLGDEVPWIETKGDENLW